MSEAVRREVCELLWRIRDFVYSSRYAEKFIDMRAVEAFRDAACAEGGLTSVAVSDLCGYLDTLGVQLDKFSVNVVDYDHKEFERIRELLNHVKGVLCGEVSAGDRFERVRQEVGYVLANFVAAFRTVGDTKFEIRASVYERVLNLVLCVESVGAMHDALELIKPYDSELAKVLQRRVLELI